MQIPVPYAKVMQIQSLRRGSMVLQFNELSRWFLWTVKLESPPLQFLGTLTKATLHRWGEGAMVYLPPASRASYFRPDTQEFPAGLPSEVRGCWWAHSHIKEVFTGRPCHIVEQKKPCLLTSSLGSSQEQLILNERFNLSLSPSSELNLLDPCSQLCAGQLLLEFPRAP